MIQVTLDSSIDDSTKLQKKIDSVGNNPARFICSDAFHITIQSRIRFWNNFEFDAGGSTLELMENARTTIFGEQVPLIGSKLTTGVTGWNFHSAIFEGNREHQSYVPLKDSKNWGLGYHNFIGPFDVSMIKNSVPANSSNIQIHDCEFNNNLGDGIRIEGGQKDVNGNGIKIWNIKGKSGGHDLICLAAVNGGEAYNVVADGAVNAILRTRESNNIKFYDCNLNGGTGIEYAPVIEIEAKSRTSGNIEIYNNEIRNSFGPGIQVAGNIAGNGLVSIHNNLLTGCGQMPASNKLSGVGAIVADGFNLDIENNTIDLSNNGILLGDYDIASTYKFTATIKRNIITNTKVPFYPGLMAGTAICDLTNGRYSVTSSENCLFRNVANYYKVNSTSDILCDPKFLDYKNGNYHLRSEPKQPCLFPTYELGCYCGIIGAATYLPPDDPQVTISQPDEDKLHALVNFLIEDKYITLDDIVGYKNLKNQ